MLGRRRIFFVGTAFFAAFSLLGGIAQTAPWLIGARVGMGVGGALMWPAILGMTFAALPKERAGLAGGLILGIAGLGNAVGPLIGGVLTDELSWRWIFFLNIPVAGCAALFTARYVHQPPVEDAERRIDYVGIATVSGGLVALLLGLDQAVDWGWTDARVLGLFVLAVLLLTGFAVIERRVGETALIPPDVIAHRAFRAACLTVLMISAVFFAIVLYGPQLMEKILGWSALKAGAGLLPMLALFAAVSFLAGRLYERVGGRPVILAGTACLAAGPLLLSFFGADSGYAALVPGLVVAGVGAGLFYPSITTAAVTMLDETRSSLAGGITYMFQIAGGAVGLDTSVADRVLDVVRESFVTGVAFSLRVIAAIAVVGLLIAILGIRLGEQPEAAPAPAEA
jgi:MFS family permease